MSKKILIVEDEIQLVQALSIKLKEAGFEVLAAYDGIQGLDLAEKHRPDLILCDIKMPKMDGLTMLEKIRAANWGNDIIVMMLSNSGSKEKISAALTNWVARYFVKSDWDLEKIVAEIKKVLP
ncbi:MAG: response regulator [Patescibacteria group bacterium]